MNKVNFIKKAAVAVAMFALVTAYAQAQQNMVLTENIVLTGHTPIANFTGNFYGNGHTITIKSFASGVSGNVGFFGTVSGGVVRDLTIVYDTDGDPATPHGKVTVPTGAAQFGGIAGTASGNAQFVNVLVKGEVEVSVNGDNTAFVGGLVGQMTGRASVHNAYGGLKLTVNKSDTGQTASLYVGGIVGSMGTPTTGAAVRVEEASVVGNITVGDSQAVNVADSSNGLCVGGVAGYIHGTGTGAVLRDCDYRQGTISVRSGSGSANIGGAVGKVQSATAISDCRSVAGNFTIHKEGAGNTFYVGGFIGDHQGGSIRRSYSENPVVVNTSSGATGQITPGGFSGRVSSNASNPVEYCYAKGNVSVLAYGRIYIGGFTGIFYAGSSVSYSYATGNVSAISRSNAIVNAGGFSGNSNDMSNCYATGDVFVDNIGGGTIYAGGLSGTISSAVVTVENCFAAGAVIVQRDGDGETNAGGLAGSLLNAGNTLRNNAALGASVTVTGATTANRSIGRIYGSTVNSAIRTNNHAFNDMTLSESNTYGAPASGRTPVALTVGRGAKDGADAHLGIFRDRRFWENQPPADNTVTFNIASHGLDFSSTVWDFSTVEGKSRPRLLLRDAEGRLLGVMGGQ